MKKIYFIPWLLGLFIHFVPLYCSLLKSNLGAKPKLPISKRVNISTQPNYIDVILNGDTFEEYESRSENIIKITPLERYSKYYFFIDKELYIANILPVYSESKKTLDIIASVDLKNNTILINYRCMDSGVIVITYKLEIQETSGENQYHKLFSVAKYCGNFPIMSLKMGYSSSTSQGEATGEIINNGRVNPEFGKEDLPNEIEERSTFEIFYLSYQAQVMKYQYVLGLSQDGKGLTGNTKLMNKLKEIAFEDVYFEVEYHDILKPDLIISDKKYNTSIRDLNSPYFFTSHKQDPSSFLSLKDDQIELQDNLEEETQPNSQTNFTSLVNEDFAQRVFSIDSLTGMQNGLLKKLNNLLINNQMLLSEKLEKEEKEKAMTSQTDEDSNIADDIVDGDNQEKDKANNGFTGGEVTDDKKNSDRKKQKSNKQTLLESMLKKQFDVSKTLESQLSLVKLKQSMIEALIRKAFESGAVNKNPLDTFQKIKGVLNRNDIESLTEAEGTNNQERIIFKKSKSDITLQMEDLEPMQKLFPFVMRNSLEEIRIDFNCMREGTSLFRLILVPKNPFNPFEPMKIEWKKKCGRKRPHPSFLVGFSSAEFKVVVNGIVNKNFTKEVANYTLSAKNDSLSFFIKLNKTSMPVQKIQSPLIRVSDSSILTVQLDSRFKQRGDSKIVNDSSNVSIEVTTNSVFMVTVKFTCLSFGVARIDFVLPMASEDSPYRDIEFSVKKVCLAEQLAINLYDYNPGETLANQTSKEVLGNIIYNERWNHSNTPNISSDTDSVTFYLKSLNLKNTLIFKTNVAVKGQNNSMGVVDVSPKDSEVGPGKVWEFTIFFVCYNGGRFKTEVNLTVEMYNHFQFMVIKNCNNWERFQKVFVQIAILVPLLLFIIMGLVIFLARRGILPNNFLLIVERRRITERPIAIPTENAFGFIKYLKKNAAVGKKRLSIRSENNPGVSSGDSRSS